MQVQEEIALWKEKNTWYLARPTFPLSINTLPISGNLAIINWTARIYRKKTKDCHIKERQV